MEDSQFEAWDMLAGRMSSELGGSEDLLDIVGMNYYASNQWVHGGPRLGWEGSARVATQQIDGAGVGALRTASIPK